MGPVWILRNVLSMSELNWFFGVLIPLKSVMTSCLILEVRCRDVHLDPEIKWFLVLCHGGSPSRRRCWTLEVTWTQRLSLADFIVLYFCAALLVTDACLHNIGSSMSPLAKGSNMLPDYRRCVTLHDRMAMREVRGPRKMFSLVRYFIVQIWTW